MRRTYTKLFEEHCKEHRQMLFVMGPRQVGKTTTSLALLEMTKAPYAFQVVLDMPYINRSCFDITDRPVIVPARTFLSQLV